MLEKLKQAVSNNVSAEDRLIKIHHRFMREYGYIPLKDFMELPLHTTLNLLECIEEEQGNVKKRLGKYGR